MSATTTSLPVQSRSTAIAPTTVAIHQPNYFGWLGFFSKVASCDQFVILDDVQFVRRGFIHRNRVKTPNGVSWLTVPTRNKGLYHARINQLATDHEQGWTARHRRTLQHSYGRCRYYAEIRDLIVDPVLDFASNPEVSLADCCIHAIEHVCAYLQIEVPMVRSSAMGIESSSTQRLIDIVRRVGGRRYLSGMGGRKYMQPELFDQNRIELAFTSCSPAAYEQPWGEFVPGLSILDTLCCCGPATRDMLNATTT